MADWRERQHLEIPALVIGGGFGGIYTLHRLRQNGIDAKLFEAGTSLGGVWHWNRYPGARVDSEQPYYQLNIPEVWKDWTWKERFPGDEELRQYFHHAATVLGLYDHIALGEIIHGCDFDVTRKVWTIGSSTGRSVTCKYLIIAAGSSYKKFNPDFPGAKDYEGRLFHAADFPREGIDFTGKRVAVIGQGSTGVQLVQEISKRAEHLGIFLRVPHMAYPLHQRKMSEEEQHQNKSILPILLKLCRNSAPGLPYYTDGANSKDVSKEEREVRWEETWTRGGFNFVQAAFQDYIVDQEANDWVYEFWRKKVLQRVKDPRKREIIAPKIKPYPIGCKRPVMESDYYDCVDRPNVEITSLTETPLERFDKQGIITSDGKARQYDVVILATGYDAVTGSFTNMGLRDTEGVDMRDRWKDGVRTHLGMACPGFPNMFMVYSPQAPTALANAPQTIEAQGDWIVSTIIKMKKEGIETIEAQPEAAEKWARHIQEMADKTLFAQTDSWWMGSNIPGKKREMLMYLGGVENYEKTIKEHQQSLRGFTTVSVA